MKRCLSKQRRIGVDAAGAITEALTIWKMGRRRHFTGFIDGRFVDNDICRSFLQVLQVESKTFLAY